MRKLVASALGLVAFASLTSVAQAQPVLLGPGLRKFTHVMIALLARNECDFDQAV
jgi:hypothetical protein